MWIVVPVREKKIFDSIGRQSLITVGFDKIWGLRDKSIRDDILKGLNEKSIPWKFTNFQIFDDDITSITEDDNCFWISIKQSEDRIGFVKEYYIQE